MTFDETTAVRAMVLIDDDADFLYVLKRCVQSQSAAFAPSGSLDIKTYSDPVEAVVNLPVDPICVIIIDYNMPGCTGLDWIPKLVAAGIGPVLLLTNQNDANVTAAAFRAGAANYLSKTDAVAGNDLLARAVREAVHRYRLETRNVTLTRQLKLVNAELESKNKHLSELTETAHQFVDDVAHDLRTPLTVIGQFTSIIADGIGGPVTDSQKNHLATIATASHEMAEMIDDFLDSSKLKARALSVDREAHKVQELLDAVVPMLSARAQPKGISVTQAVAEGTGMFFGDLSKAGRVLTNLAVNAIKVTPDGQTVRLWANPTAQGDVQFSIIDEGQGLKPDEVKIIFERFKQLDGPQVSGTKGFGLGLSIVKQLAWFNLGLINVQSEPGKGSIFSFTLPGNNLSRILDRYIESIRAIDKTDDLQMLEISWRGDGDLSSLRRLVASYCYPMDLVLRSPNGNSIKALGVCSDTDAWSSRIRQAVSRFQNSIGQPAELEISKVGSWGRDRNKAELQAALIEALDGAKCHV